MLNLSQTEDVCFQKGLGKQCFRVYKPRTSSITEIGFYFVRNNPLCILTKSHPQHYGETVLEGKALEFEKEFSVFPSSRSLFRHLSSLSVNSLCQVTVVCVCVWGGVQSNTYFSCEDNKLEVSTIMVASTCSPSVTV